MPYPLPLTRTEAYLAYKAGVIQQSDLKLSLAVPRNGIDAWLAYWTGLAADYPKREDGTPHILQEEEAYIAYLCGVINEYPEKCLRRVGAYLRYLISARWGRPDHPLNREELYLSLIKTQFIPSGDPSSDIVIDGTTKAPFVDVELYGDTFQQTYTGKNLFNKNDTGILDDVRVSTSNGKTYGAVGNHVSYFIKVEPSTTYVLTTGRTAYYAWYSAPSEDSYISGSGWGDEYYFTSPADAQYIRFDFADGNIVQFVEGTSVGDYEPYVGGQPSPNPDYPQPIQTVTGEQTVEIVGKNLFDKANVVNGIPSQTDGSVVSTSSIGRTSDYIPVVSSTVYSHTGHPAGWAVIAWYKADKSFIERTDDVTTTTSPNEAAYARVSCAESNLGTCQFEIGQPTTYAPYHVTSYPLDLGNIELCKLGTYQDYIWKDGNDWKVHKATASAIIDGSESWDTSGTNTFYVANIYSKIGNSIQSASTGEMYASHFTIVDIASSDTLVGASLKVDAAHNVSNLRIRLQDMSGGTAGFRQMLSTKKPSIYARRLTPTDTTITDTNLIAQLEALKNGGAENGTTYIKVNATDPNLPGLLYVEAPKYE